MRRKLQGRLTDRKDVVRCDAGLCKLTKGSMEVWKYVARCKYGSGWEEEARCEIDQYGRRKDVKGAFEKRDMVA